MNLELSLVEADFLAAQLRRHIHEVEGELARTDKHQMQHALACDAAALQTILDRLTSALAKGQAERRGAPLAR